MAAEKAADKLQESSLLIQTLKDNGADKYAIPPDGKKNTADLGTKDLAEAEMRKCLSDLYVGESSGQHPLALRSVST